MVLITSYEESDDEEGLETVPVNNNNYNINVVSDSEDDSSNEDLKNDEGIFSTKKITIKL